MIFRDNLPNPENSLFCILVFVESLAPIRPQFASMFLDESVRHPMAKAKPITIGTVNTTGIADLQGIVDDINQSLDRVQKVGNEWVADILRELSQAVITDPRLKTQPRQATIETLQSLAHEASLPPGKRQFGNVKFAIAYISLMLDTSLNVLNYLKVHLTDLKKFFGIPG